MITITLTFEPQGFELHGSTFMWLFFNKFSAIESVVESTNENHGYGEPSVQLYVEFPVC